MVRKMTGSVVLVYDDEGQPLVSSQIWSHDIKNDIIEISDLPELEADGIYDLLIPMAPSPYACKGKVVTRGMGKYLMLFRLKESENRRETRYAVNFAADIENLIYDDVHYDMHRPVSAQVQNLSKGGIRIKTMYNALLEGDRLCLRLKLGEQTVKRLTAHVVYRADTEREASEYGCRLLASIELV